MATFNNDFKVKHGLVVSTTATILSGLQSTSTTTGALVVRGGLGVGGNINVGGNLIVKGVDIFNYDSDIWYVSDNTGDDINNDGHRVQSAFRTIGKALSVANPGDTVFIEPGTYYETFPLTIPQGVAVRGSGLRETTVYPTTATNTYTAFLLNGETSISDFTVRGFYKPGYAFAFAPGAKITLRSPYIERFTVLTQGSTTSGSDPYGFASGDAGGGAYLDASVLDPTSLEPAMLWNEATFIVPNATGMYMTNGARSELLNGFFYFADTAINAVTGTTGFGGQGKTRLRLSGITGVFTPGDTITYKDSAGVTKAAGIIYSTSSDYVYLSGPVYGFEAAADRTGKVVTAYGNAQQSTVRKKFGNSSALFDGTGDYLEITTNGDFGYSTNNFTIEFWSYQPSFTPSGQTLIDQRTSATDISILLDTNISGQVRLFVDGSYRITSNTTLTSGAWNHVAVSRVSGTTRMFINGTVQTSTYADSNDYSARPLVIGSNYLGSSGLVGNIDDLRVTKGVGRYTTTFVPSSNTLASDDGTVLLLHMNGGEASITFADDAIAAQNVYSSNGATANRITLADYHQFGAELRCIGSAAVFGNRGIIANGTGTDLKLIAFNLSYIGSGKDLTDDGTLVVQANEIIQQNGGKIYYQTVDQNGDFRVGDSFLVNQRTGNVSFGAATVDIANLSSLTITDGVNTTNLTPGNISVDSLILASNQISTLAGNLTISPAGGLVTINTQLTVNGTVNAGDMYSNGQLVLTSGGGGGGYVSTITAGTDTALSTSTGAITIWNTSTLQTITGRGATTTNAISITNVTSATNTTTGALQVTGGIGVQGTVHAAGGNPDQSYELYSPKVTMAGAAPSTSTNKIGDFWIDTGSGIEYQWIKDGTNYYWVQFVGI